MTTSTSACNDTAFKNSVYELSSHENFGQWVITKYCFNGQNENLNKAASAITQFLKDNPNFCATFPVDPQKTLMENIKTKPYLIINGLAICISEKRKAIGDDRYKDIYFSESLLDEPIKCTEGHYLEKKSAELWKAKKGDRCPAGEHPIGSMEIDYRFQRTIMDYKEEQNELNIKLESLELADRRKNMQILH